MFEYRDHGGKTKDLEALGSRLDAANRYLKGTGHVPSGGLKVFICEMWDEDGESERLGGGMCVCVWGGQFSKILFNSEILLINPIAWNYSLSWYKRKQFHGNPLYLILCSLNFVKNKGRMDENTMFEEREMVNSRGKLPSRRKGMG